MELVNLRLGVRAPAALPSIDVVPNGQNPKPPGQAYVADLGIDVPLLDRDGLAADAVIMGPLLLTEENATAWVKPDWQMRPDKWGNLLLARRA